MGEPMGKHGQFSITPARALDDTRFDGKDKHLRALMVLATFADKNGWCYPSLSTVSEWLMISRSTLSEIFHDMEEWGYLLIIHRKGDDESPTSNKYRIIHDAELPVRFDRTNAEHPVRKAYEAKKHAVREARKAREQGVREPQGESVPNAPSNAPLNDPVESTGDSKTESPTPEPIVTFDDLTGMQDETPEPIKDAAIKIFHEVRGMFPPKEQYSEIEETVGCEPVALDFWRKVLLEYSAIGWNRKSVRGPLDWFKKGELPHVERKNGVGASPGKAASILRAFERYDEMEREAASG